MLDWLSEKIGIQYTMDREETEKKAVGNYAAVKEKEKRTKYFPLNSEKEIA